MAGVVCGSDALRNVIEWNFRRLRDFHLMASPYGKLAESFLTVVVIASIVSYWL